MAHSWMKDPSFKLNFPPELTSEITKILRSSGISYDGVDTVRKQVPGGDHDRVFDYILNASATIEQKRSEHALETIRKKYVKRMRVYTDATRKHPVKSHYEWDGLNYVIVDGTNEIMAESGKSSMNEFNTIMSLAAENGLTSTHAKELLEMCTEPYYYEKFEMTDSYTWNGKYSTVGDAIYMYTTYNQDKRSEYELLKLVSMSIEQDAKPYVDAKITIHGPTKLLLMTRDDMVRRRNKIIESTPILRYLDKITQITSEDLNVAILRNELDFSKIKYPHIIDNIRLIAAKVVPNTWANISNVNGCYKATGHMVSFDE